MSLLCQNSQARFVKYFRYAPVHAEAGPVIQNTRWGSALSVRFPTRYFPAHFRKVVEVPSFRWLVQVPTSSRLLR